MGRGPASCEGARRRLDRCKQLCKYYQAMHGLAQGEGPRIRFRMITAGEFRAPAGRVGAAGRRGRYRRNGVSGYRRSNGLCGFGGFSCGLRNAIFRAKRQESAVSAVFAAFWWRRENRTGGRGEEAGNGVSVYRRVGVSASEKQPQERERKKSTPHPVPLASQARHELVSLGFLCASRNVVPDRGGEGEELDGNYFYDSEPFHKFCSRTVRPSGSGLFGFWLRFRSVTGRCGHAPSLKRGLPKPCESVSQSGDVPLRGKQCQKPKILAPHGYTISRKAPAGAARVAGDYWMRASLEYCTWASR